MEYGIWDGTLEIRQEGDRPVLTGRFPYNVQATVAKGGRVRKERFASMSMSWQVREFQKLQQQLSDLIGQEMEALRKERLIAQLEDTLEKRNTHLLQGHSFDKPIADMKSGSLSVVHTAKAVELEATLPPVAEQPSWVRDAVLAVRGGQLRGISPGFQVTSKGGERLVREDGPGDSLVRELLDSVVFEYSLVSRPAYPMTSVDARSDDPRHEGRRRWWL